MTVSNWRYLFTMNQTGQELLGDTTPAEAAKPEKKVSWFRKTFFKSGNPDAPKARQLGEPRVVSATGRTGKTVTCRPAL